MTLLIALVRDSPSADRFGFFLALRDFLAVCRPMKEFVGAFVNQRRKGFRGRHAGEQRDLSAFGGTLRRSDVLGVREGDALLGAKNCEAFLVVARIALNRSDSGGT